MLIEVFKCHDCGAEFLLGSSATKHAEARDCLVIAQLEEDPR